MSALMDLARMCCTEVGVPTDDLSAYWALDGHEWLQWEADSPREHWYIRVSLLVMMKTRGPDTLVRCNVHALEPDGWDQCGKVTLAAACLGASCHIVRSGA